jgi:hypothetical protein
VKYAIRWSQLQGPSTDDLKMFWDDLANAVAFLAAVAVTLAWLMGAL